MSLGSFSKQRFGTDDGKGQSCLVAYEDDTEIIIPASEDYTGTAYQTADFAVPVTMWLWP